VEQLRSCSRKPVSDGDLETLAVIITMCMEGVGYYAPLAEPGYRLAGAVAAYREILERECLRILF